MTTIDNKRILQIVKYSFIYISVGTIFFYFYNGLNPFVWKTFLWNIGYSCCIGFPMQLLGNILKYINKKDLIDWINKPKKSILISLSIMTVYACLVIALVQWLWWIVLKDLTWEQYLASPDLLSHCFFLFIAIFLITLIYQTISFFTAYRDEAIEKEKLKHQTLAMRYEVMQNQMRPHFLYNALNTAQSLVDIDGERTKTYLNQLANFYRSMTVFSEEQLIPLEDELDFVNNYIFLQSIRFGDNLTCDIKIEHNEHGYVVPMTLQTLVENAIKHNIISHENPLRIEITIINQKILVKNTLQPKKQQNTSSGKGLKNLSARYKFLTNDQLEIHRDNLKFTISIPLIPDIEYVGLSTSNK